MTFISSNKRKKEWKKEEKKKIDFVEKITGTIGVLDYNIGRKRERLKRKG